MLASALGLGLFLAGASASAQNWVPSGSPYGTWRKASPTSQPVPTSWRESSPAQIPDTTPPASKPATAPAPPPLPPSAATDKTVPLPPLPPAEQDTPRQTLPIPQAETLAPPPAPAAAKQPAVIPVRHEIEEIQQPAPNQKPEPSVIQRAEFQPPIGLVEDRRGGEGRQLEFIIQLEPPGPDRLFRLESEAALNERMRQEGKNQGLADKIIFPEEPVVSREQYPGRNWPPQSEIAEPNYVCYRRLLFEERNAERFGWDFGILQPVFSAGKFYADVVALPYHIATAPCRCYECSAGMCLPGDPVPYLCYPTELSLTGALAEAGAVGGILAIFP
jgi:hypothetical protein